MRISELAESTGVALATVKYYLREGLLMPGEATSRTRAEYDDRHVQRVRLIRALIESGGLGIAGVRSVVSALEDPPGSPHELLGVAHRAVPPPVPADPVDAEVRDLLAHLGWDRCHPSPLAGSLTRAIADARAAGIPLALESLRRYAEGAQELARVDVDVATAAPSPEEALHAVVVGTVMLEPVIATLRRLAQEVVSAEALGVISPE